MSRVDIARKLAEMLLEAIGESDIYTEDFQPFGGTPETELVRFTNKLDFSDYGHVVDVFVTAVGLDGVEGDVPLLSLHSDSAVVPGRWSHTSH